ncbi:MAG TPA: ABC transporter permease [Streptosporangiaceae bacterium]|nr:ABC transporter permease [Streptosporangiaceae bacterium]
MTAYLMRRLLQAIFVTFFVTVVVFVLLQMLPGGPVRALLPLNATHYQVVHLTREYGYDKPLVVQYGRWLWQLLHGNLGYSVHLNMPVSQSIIQALPKTIVLMALSIVLALLLGVPLGVYQAARRYRAGDYVLTGISFLGYGTPPFFIGLLLIDWLAVDVHAFPAEAPQGTSVAQVLSQPNALVLPVITLAFAGFALWSRYMRSSVMDNLVQDYVRTARATGASERQVLWRHVFRNSLVTIVTLLGLSLPGLFAGAVITESVFNYPGMGLLFWQAAQDYDYPVLLGTALIGTLATIIGNLLADIGYAALDPRVRYA